MALATAVARSSSSTESRSPTAFWSYAALLVALVGLAGTLFLSLGMSLKACPLCFYQRTFMMSLVAVLSMGLLTGMGRFGRLGLLAMPLAVAGLGVALFHVYLESSGKLECPKGLLGLGSAPQQSLIVFAVLVAVLLADLLRGLSAARDRTALGGALILGGLLAFGSCISNPPMTPLSRDAYAKPPDGCRVRLVP